jgi:hypothetical protein
MTPFFAVIGLVSGIRHIIFSGRLGKRYGGIWKRQDSLFEYEACVANLAFGIMFVIARGKNLSEEVKSVLNYGIPMYLLGSAIVHIYAAFSDRKFTRKKIFTITMLQMSCVILLKNN